MFGFLRAHVGKDSRLASAREWAQKKGLSDITKEENRKYWRIHDDFYDLTDFKHPGGKEWILVTRGNDITEMFESSHPNIEMVRKLLPKYRVGPANEPRNSGAFTFNKDGFYSVFRDRAWNILKDKGTGPTVGMLLIHDSLLVLFLALLFCIMNPSLGTCHWLVLAVPTAFVLQCLGTCAHNFYHQRANWRMYSWDLAPYSSDEWRISHAYSHHTFPNTAYDYEVMVFEPYLEYLPVKKGIIRLLTGPFVLQLIACLGMHLQGIQRYARFIMGTQTPRWENGLPFLLLAIITLIRVYWIRFIGLDETILQSMRECAIRQNVVYVIASFFFHNISLGAGHHNPLIWHEGDKIPDSLDWGLFQIISVARFETVDKSLLLTSVSFGNHALHHLLPTVDHSKLPLLFPVYVQTCKEFGVDFNNEWFQKRNSGLLMGWVAMIKQEHTLREQFPFEYSSPEEEAIKLLWIVPGGPWRWSRCDTHYMRYLSRNMGPSHLVFCSNFMYDCSTALLEVLHISYDASTP